MSEITESNNRNNMLDICAQLNTSEMKLLQFLRDEIQDTGSTTVVPADSDNITPYIRVALKKGYKHLNEIGILERLDRGTYIVMDGLFSTARPYVPATKAVLNMVADDIVSSHTGDAAIYLKRLGL